MYLFVYSDLIMINIGRQGGDGGRGRGPPRTYYLL